MTRTTAHFAFLLAALCLPCAAATIGITRIQVNPAEVAPGDSFVVSVAAEGKGVEVGSYRIRTPYRVAEDEVPPGFIRQSGHAVYKGDGGAIFDNAPCDLDAAEGAIAVRIGTRGFARGTHYLVVFAHNRPAPGAHVLDYRNLRLDVGPDKVRISILPKGTSDMDDPVEFHLPEPVLTPGEPLVCGARLREGETGPLALRLRPPYTWGEDEALPGFSYYAKEAVGYIEDGLEHMIRDGGPSDRDPAAGSIRVEVPTADWPSGIHVLTLQIAERDVRAPYGGASTLYRDFAVKIPDPRDQLVVEVEPSVYFAEGTHFQQSLLALPDGDVLAEGRLSEDGGRTWTRLAKSIPRANLLVDGTILGMAYKALPVEGEKGVYRGSLRISTDGGRTVRGPLPSRVLVPKAREALGHSLHVGPLFGRSIVELDGGELISAMYGWFEGDAEPDRYREGGTMRRSYIGRSGDRGKTWEYLSTVAYRPFLGNEGYSELVIRRLPNGEILALVRTGGNSNPGWHDNPLMLSRSSDGGRTWSPVERTGVEGVWPDLLVMSDGTLACSYGRPGAHIMFSTDNGRTWTDHTSIDAERYSGYTAICEVAPGEILYGFGARAWPDPKTGGRRDCLRLARIRVRRR